MRLTLTNADTTLDVHVTAAADSITVGDLFAAAGLPLAPGTIVRANDTICGADTPLHALAVPDGSILSVDSMGSRHLSTDGDAALTDDGGTTDDVMDLVCVAGPGTGSTVTLGYGSYDFCQVSRTGVSTSEATMFRVDVAPAGRGAVGRVSGLSGSHITVDGDEVGDIPRSGSWLAAGGSVFRLSPAGPRHRRPVTGGGPRVAFVRPPRVLPNHHPKPIVAPSVPPEPRQPEPLSILLLVLPIPIGIAMAFFFSPFFLVFSLMSPIMAIGRSYDGKRRLARQTTANIEQMDHDLAEFTGALHRAALVAAEQRRSERHDLAALADIARHGDVALWRSRPDHPDFLRPLIGMGPSPWEPEILGDLGTEALVAAVVDAGHLPTAPIDVDLRHGVALGVVGPPNLSRRLAAAVICQLVVDHGPADMALAALLDESSAPAWDHLKWLPHLADESGALRVACGAEEAERMVSSLLPEPDRGSHAGFFRPSDDNLETPVPVFLVDSATLIETGVRPLAARLPRLPGRAVIIADDVNALPALCTAVAEIRTGDHMVRLTDVVAGQRHAEITGLYLEPDVGADLSRALARFVDPDSSSSVATLPDFVRLVDVVAPGFDADDVHSAWVDPPDGCRAVLGTRDSGPMEIDLLRDGPHGLVAGTTGAGKSELLRSMIMSMAVRYPPDQVTFVLVDFKGGGAFDVFEDLPHNVGIVTDLDEHLAGRALRCLRAELKYREHRLRDAGVSDLIDLPPGHDPLPRLIIVVDEFATLAAELPDFLNSLVDVAQRGRSLGIHMILATQRPTGVVDAKIRANTNLRIALRVQDDGDSLDVIGSKSAAEIDRRLPGRAFARLGASELVGFQTALVSIHTDEQAGPALNVESFDLIGGADLIPDDGLAGGPVGDGEHEPGYEDPPTDLERYVQATRSAFEAMGMDEPRVPWPDPLPDHIDADALLTDALLTDALPTDTLPTDTLLTDTLRTPVAQPWATPFALADHPDDQCQRPAWWQATDGNVAVYGMSPAATSPVVTTLLMGLAHRHSADEFHCYIIDFAASLSGLKDLPHCGSYVTGDDDERLLRTIQLMEHEIDRRRRLLQTQQISSLEPVRARAEGVPLTVLAITNYGAVLEMFEELGELGGPGRLGQIIRDGPAVGLYVFVAAGSERDIPNRVAQQIEAKLVLRMADPNASMMFGLKPKELPELSGLRAIDVRTGTEIQVATFDDDRVRSAGGSANTTMSGPVKVRLLGDDIPADAVVTRSRADGPNWHLVVGLDSDRLEPAGLGLRGGQHVVVTGPVGAGKTTALQTLAVAARHSDPSCAIAVVSSRPDEWNHLVDEFDLTGIGALLSDDTPTRPGRRELVLIDGIESVDPPASLFDKLAASPPEGLHLVVAGRPDSFRLAPAWVRAVTSHRIGLALRATAEAGDLYRCRFPTPKNEQPPGRGYIVNQGIPQLAQVARLGRPTDPVESRTESSTNDVAAV